jgi:hypothetical protein
MPVFVDDMPPTLDELRAWPISLLCSTFLELVEMDDDMQLLDVNRCLLERILKTAEFGWSVAGMHEDLVLAPFRQESVGNIANNDPASATSMELILSHQARKFRKAFEALAWAIDTIHQAFEGRREILLEHAPVQLVLDVQNAYLNLQMWQCTVSKLKPEEALPFVMRLVDFDLVVYAERKLAGLEDKHKHLTMLSNVLHYSMFNLLTLEQLNTMVPRVKNVIFKYNLCGKAAGKEDDDQATRAAKLMEALDLDVGPVRSMSSRFSDTFSHYTAMVMRDVVRFYAS